MPHPQQPYGQGQQRRPYGARLQPGSRRAGAVVAVVTLVGSLLATVGLVGFVDPGLLRGNARTAVARGGGEAPGTSAAAPTATRAGQPNSSAPARQRDPATIRPGEKVTKERLAKVPAAGFYWDLLHRQMTRPVSLISSVYFQTPAQFKERRSFYSVGQLGIDHRTGAFTAARTAYQEGRVSTMNRCVDRKYYFRSSYSDEWSHLEGSDNDCVTIPGLMHSAATDGIVASGLSEAQADKVVASLRDAHKGFAHPAAPTLVTADGKTYIRQLVDYTPIKFADGLYWGTMIFGQAFKETGLDPETWPWYSGLGPGEGLHVVYYLDPQTLLPVASVMRSTPVLDEQGREKTRYDQTMVFNYEFPAKLPVPTLKDTTPVAVTLPEGWRIPR